MLNIIAVEYISLSELETALPSITKEWIDNNHEEFKQMLFELGLDCFNYPVTEQHNTHRNRFGNVNTTYRWVCNSRLDEEWVNSPYSSYEAKAKSKNNKLLIDLFRLKGLVDSE